jgi:hypothetical protein
MTFACRSNYHLFMFSRLLHLQTFPQTPGAAKRSRPGRLQAGQFFVTFWQANKRKNIYNLRSQKTQKLIFHRQCLFHNFATI